MNRARIPLKIVKVYEKADGRGSEAIEGFHSTSQASDTKLIKIECPMKPCPSKIKHLSRLTFNLSPH